MVVSCNALVHNKCSGLTGSELKYLTLKNLNLKYFCNTCNGLSLNHRIKGVKIDHDFNLVHNVINFIVSSNNIIKSIKLIHLGKHGQNYCRPIKTIFGSPSEVFNILKLKKKLSSLQPTSTI